MNVVINSKDVQPGDIFICLPGGESYIPEATANGASQVLRMTRTELGIWADDYFGNPSLHLVVIGITGTNGKTTVTNLVNDALNQSGFNAMVQGTLTGALTTPESLTSHHAMAKHLQHGGTHFVMEVSSHAIDQDRISGIRFHVKLLTNITQDHLDYHKTLASYTATKRNWLAKSTAKNMVSITPEDFQKESIDFNNPLIGEFNKRNMQATIAILHALQLPEATIHTALASSKAPPGRFETINANQPFTVIIDYAHTPDGLENVLAEAHLIAKAQNGSLSVLFGCGGDRDRTKRPQMAKIAATYATTIILTNDNPRTEDTTQIFDEICNGFPDQTRYLILNDRKAAIQHIIQQAQPNDVILIAGKGHETYQIIGTEKLPFNDGDEALEAIANWTPHLT